MPDGFNGRLSGRGAQKLQAGIVVIHVLLAEEKSLAAQVPDIAQKVKKLSADRQYEPALVEISRLRPAVDAFFDKVMVMVEDEGLRANRLGLLRTLLREFSSIADFSEIVTERK